MYLVIAVWEIWNRLSHMVFSIAFYTCLVAFVLATNFNGTCWFSCPRSLPCQLISKQWLSIVPCHSIWSTVVADCFDNCREMTITVTSVPFTLCVILRSLLHCVLDIDQIRCKLKCVCAKEWRGSELMIIILRLPMKNTSCNVSKRNGKIDIHYSSTCVVCPDIYL